MKTKWKVENWLIAIGALFPLVGFVLSEGVLRSRLMFIFFGGALLAGVFLGLITLLLRIGIKHFYSIPWLGDLEVSDCPQNNIVAKIVIWIAVLMMHFFVLLIGIALSAFVLRMFSQVTGD